MLGLAKLLVADPTTSGTMSDDRTVRISDRVMTRNVGGETVLLNLDSETYFGLDEVGTDMLETLETGSTVENAIRDLATRWEADPATLRRDLCDLVDGLVEHGLAEWRDEAT